MGKALIIAEKPSVAGDIAKALGKFQKKDDHYENEDYVLSSAVGHLVEICAPEHLEKKRGKWSFENLPVIPDKFALRPIEKTESRLKVLLRLIKRKDVDSLINACDAGREGELIFRYIVQMSGVEKPIQRLWLQSMTPAAIREGFQKLRPGRELEPLAQAAICRSESDWLVGINGTRAFTAFNSKEGGFFLTPVGRVQTPTLTILANREEKIKIFVPRTYWEVHGTFQALAGEYPGRWFDETFRREKQNSQQSEDDPARAERIWDKAKADAIRAKCAGKPGIVTEEKKPSSQLSPLLYDLTTLQREANGRFGMSAKNTLQVAQVLYERHKAITYPRTDSRYLPEDYLGTARNVLEIIKANTDAPLSNKSAFARKVLERDWVKPTKRIFNNAKVSDHFAIIPTSAPPSSLDEYEYKIYDMIVKRFIAVFYPAAQFEVTTRITRVEQEPFKTEGKIMLDPGWMEVYGRELGEEGEKTLPAVALDQPVQTSNVEIKEAQTKPPARFNEATLLSAMEGAGKLVEDEELREAMSAKGLGTPATRAAIIEGLIYEKYVVREGKELVATPKGIALIEMLRTMHVDALCSPEMTGEWEFKLKQMEKGELSRPEFMQQITGLTRSIVDSARNFKNTDANLKSFPGRSPIDGAEMVETLKEYKAVSGNFSMRKILAGRLLEPQEAVELIEKRFVGPLSGFRSKMGRPFSAALKLTDEWKVEFVFENAPGEGGNGEAVDFSNQEPLGRCPKCGARVFEGLLNYVCENSVLATPTCKFRTGKKILGKEIPREQVLKLLQTGKTDLIPGFISQRTKRPFSAYLKVDETGKVSFEFEPRPPKEAKGKGKSQKAAATQPSAAPTQASET